MKARDQPRYEKCNVGGNESLKKRSVMEGVCVNVFATSNPHGDGTAMIEVSLF